MSTRFSGQPNAPNLPPDTGEWKSQQGVTLGYVSALERRVMAILAEIYDPEYEVNGQRKVTQWRRGGTPQNPVVAMEDPALQPNWFIGEQYLSLNYAPQTIVFCRAPGPHAFGPTPMIGNHRTGYRQIYSLNMAILTRIYAFDDDDGQELLNAIVGAAYYASVQSTQGPVAESMRFLPKVEDSRGSVLEFTLRLGLPITLPPLAPGCVERVLVTPEIVPNA